MKPFSNPCIKTLLKNLRDSAKGTQEGKPWPYLALNAEPFKEAEYYAKAQNSPKALYSMVLHPKSLRI